MKTNKAHIIQFLLLLLLVFSCSPDKKYKTLSFFFDGVPLPSDTTVFEELHIERSHTDSLLLQTDSSLKSFERIIYHDPYRYRGCNSCHDSKSVGTMISDEPGLCYQCHEDYSVRYSFSHGPVDGGFCTVCHNPHSSNKEKLLNQEVNNLCCYCHNPEELSAIDMHREGNGFICTACHNPHGGDNKLLLVR